MLYKTFQGQLSLFMSIQLYFLLHVLTNYFNVPLSNSNVEILQLENSLLFNDLGKAANPHVISVVTVRDFTKFRIPPPLSFELEKSWEFSTTLGQRI